MRVGIFWLLVMAGCASAPQFVGPSRPQPGLELRLPPVALGRELHLSQRITVTRQGERHSFEAQLEVDAAAVRIAAVAFGQTVASLSWDGVSLEQRVSSHVPEAVTAARILSDVQLAWWPVDAIREGLPPGYRLEEHAATREVFLNQSLVVTVHYEGVAPVWRQVRLIHASYGYTLDIESVEASP